MKSEVIKIVVTGPESSGKSSLCEALATHYNASWCREYAREYLQMKGPRYVYDDLLAIARGQILLEEEATIQAFQHWLQPAIQTSSLQWPLLFIDTDMYVMKVWSEYVYGKVDPFIPAEISRRHYHMYLLCSPDLPWEPDALRELPDPEKRREVFGIYRQLMMNQPVPWVQVQGHQHQRLQAAVSAVDSLLASLG